ncbi:MULTISPECIES: TRAP transporter substrate-binding protein [unclassified Planococcus (in: firmicutes)]|uniref:TRAP transporter substrate-binding protein n=1 Tax=unclassified Planococcus (in: firmicutes) TaxID=2662419 RepID=UPI000C33F099|nr:MULTISPECIES: TRAP transporter substrate-binding protein [unclassified Planococcus (in: firmicutes)]AUD13112.1 TRAP transporter substrate-binding protein DctP [Planococcus sp. MB-3u-03]PKG45405.1 TRAP transporter substrate-binding protein DctP [Planococcus sp. Urea-trap-24]PKG88999.1 TRAP transporter substrate-binding protein DctP [Planococcus sp. Urea-3u-39]PKH36367.1 TRAP transporter substrate-binding protein DctP [Planococcus sp. MB-3u-09]
MEFKKGFSFATIGLSSFLLLAACGNDDSAQGSTEGEGEGESVSLRLAHNQGEDHPVHTSLVELSEVTAENSGDSVEIELFPNGQLGDERGVIELVKSGTLDMAKVSASALESFDSNYSIFSLPYVFQSEEHYFNVMDNSEAVQEIFQNTRDEGFFAAGWYTGGQRSIYTADKEIATPEDMNGMKIRVQESPTSIAMIEAMGGAPTPMSFGEVYTSLQQGVIDGAENNETGLTSNKHGEVAKAYSYTEHQYVPDVLIVSTSMWDGLSEEQQQAISDAAVESSESHKQVWADAIETAITDAEEMGVTFYDIDKQPFIDAASPLHETYQSESEDSKRYFEDFQSYVE